MNDIAQIGRLGTAAMVFEQSLKGLAVMHSLSICKVVGGLMLPLVIWL